MLHKIKKALRLIWIRSKYLNRVEFSGIQDLPINSDIRIDQKGKLVLGNQVSSIGKISLSVIGGNLTIESRTSFNRNCIIVCHDKIHIGSNCLFGPNVVAYDHDHAFDMHGVIDGKYSTGSIIIESNCWVGANVTILKGTHIGEYSVIGAGTIVKGDIPPHSLVTSNRELIIKKIENK